MPVQCYINMYSELCYYEYSENKYMKHIFALNGVLFLQTYILYWSTLIKRHAHWQDCVQTIPDPANPNQYYVFSARSIEENSDSISYHIVDIAISIPPAGILMICWPCWQKYCRPIRMPKGLLPIYHFIIISISFGANDLCNYKFRQ
jgi:hypothetical protein